MFGFHCTDFHESHSHSVDFLDASSTELFINRKTSLENAGKISCGPLSKVWLLLFRRFWNSEMLTDSLGARLSEFQPYR